MINALKKLLQGDSSVNDSITLSGSNVAASAITGGKIANTAVSAMHMGASAITVSALKYKSNTFSLAADAVGTTSAASVTYRIVTNGKMIGAYLTKLTSHANFPLYTQGTNSIAISVAQALVGSDLCEGVVITIEP
jgi:hypothetical protein